jgi:hypothetical protein
MGILEKIQDIEREIAKTQKNKATEYHLGLLKAKLAKYRVSYDEMLVTNIFSLIFKFICSRNSSSRAKKVKKAKVSMS